MVKPFKMLKFVQCTLYEVCSYLFWSCVLLFYSYFSTTSATDTMTQDEATEYRLRQHFSLIINGVSCLLYAVIYPLGWSYFWDNLLLGGLYPGMVLLKMVTLSAHTISLARLFQLFITLCEKKSWDEQFCLHVVSLSCMDFLLFHGATLANWTVL